MGTVVRDMGTVGGTWAQCEGYDQGYDQVCLRCDGHDWSGAY